MIYLSLQTTTLVMSFQTQNKEITIMNLFVLMFTISKSSDILLFAVSVTIMSHPISVQTVQLNPLFHTYADLVNTVIR